MGMLGIDPLATVDDLTEAIADKVTSTQLTEGLAGKVNTEAGKGLSESDYTTTEKTKLAGIQAGAEVNPDLSGYALTSTVNTALTGKQDTLGFTPENASNKGQANGYASLDSSGLVPSSQLPSYVDDVIEYANFAALPVTGEAGKIYVLDTPYTSGGVTSSQFRWAGSAYAAIIASPGSTDSVTEGNDNLYFTNARASAAAPVQSVAGKTGDVTLAKSDVGLGSVDNTSDASKPVSVAQQAELDLKSAKAISATGAVISFATAQVYNSVASPSASNITDDLTGAIIGVVQKIYHQNISAPTFPAGWVSLSGTYAADTLNIIFCEWAGGTRVEYWIVQ